jgi:transcriptional regulator with XRE-family HTH domain
MSNKKFLIKLSDHVNKQHWTAYAVAKQLGLNQTTVRKFMSGHVVMEYLPNHVIQIAEFYGLDWHDKSVVEVIEESLGQIKAPLALPA